MQGYCFNTNDEYELEGPEYQKLLDRCARHCVRFSLTFWRHQLFGHYQLPIFPYLCKASFWWQTPPEGCYYEEKFKCFYGCTQDAAAYLARRVNNLFDWMRDWQEGGSEADNPEDLTFYREDGSIFFQSLTHEGMCWLYPREGEDVGDIVSKPGWGRIAEDPIIFEG